MEFLTATILSGIVYDCISKGVKFCSKFIKNQFHEWLISDEIALLIENKINELNLDEDMSAKAIEKSINKDNELLSILQSVKPAESVISINQVHNGTGHNIGYINNKGN